MEGISKEVSLLVCYQGGMVAPTELRYFEKVVRQRILFAKMRTVANFARGVMWIYQLALIVVGFRASLVSFLGQ